MSRSSTHWTSRWRRCWPTSCLLRNPKSQCIVVLLLINHFSLLKTLHFNNTVMPLSLNCMTFEGKNNFLWIWTVWVSVVNHCSRQWSRIFLTILTTSPFLRTFLPSYDFTMVMTRTKSFIIEPWNRNRFEYQTCIVFFTFKLFKFFPEDKWTPYKKCAWHTCIS